jgi:predicted nuclease of predicted toxin-antitoxin system
VKLLFDENLSPRLVRLVAVGYPGSVHVRDVGLKGHVDDALWQYARGSGLVIVSKDTDFRERSYVDGFPPKVIWLDVGNVGTDAVAQLLMAEHGRAHQFEADKEASILILSLSKDAV